MVLNVKWDKNRFWSEIEQIDQRKVDSEFCRLNSGRPLEGYIKILILFQIDVSDIRHVYKRTYRGAIIHVDTDFVVGLSGQFFLMKVLVNKIRLFSLRVFLFAFLFNLSILIRFKVKHDRCKWTHEESCTRDNVKRFNNACR